MRNEPFAGTAAQIGEPADAREAAVASWMMAGSCAAPLSWSLGEDVMSEQTTVLLYEIGGLALIVPASTGIVYRNQTGGHACLPSQMEGYLVPLAGEMRTKCEGLLSHFTGPKWGGWCSERIDAETADEIDSVLADDIEARPNHR